MRLSHFRLGTRLGTAFAALVSMCVAVGVFALLQLATVHQSAEDLATNWLPSVDHLGKMQITTNQIRQAESDVVLSVGPSEAEDHVRHIDALLRTLAQEESAYRPLINSTNEQELYARFTSKREAFTAANEQLRALSGSGAPADRIRAHFLGESKSAFEAMAVPLGQLVQLNGAGAEAAHQQANKAYASAQFWLVAAAAGAALLAMGLGVVITRSVTRPVARAIAATERVAAGDLGQPIAAEGRDEIAHLLRALAAMQAQLAETVQTVRGNAESVATASAEIAQGNADLSQRTEEQAGALQQTAATMEQLSSTVKGNADSARQASALAQAAAQVAADGGEVVRQVVERMEVIHTGSGKISEIIGVIDGIAFQTNILALNAAVEAARAGEQGRGFAVVAGEVRALAQRSAAAAKEINALITANAAQIEEGSSLATQAGQTMRDVVASVRRVNDIAGEISAASAEQSHGVSQVGEAVAQMDQVTQQNAALVEQSAAAADSLKAQAQRLVEAVAVFRLTGHGAMAQPAMPLSATPPVVNAACAVRAQAPTARRTVRSAPRAQLAEPASEWAAF